jgi:hypothetical protein
MKKIKPTLEQVQGHQDNHKPYADLLLQAQLNVDAHAKVGSYQQMYPNPNHHPMTPCLPHNYSQLHLSGKVILSKTKQSIRDAFTVHSYMAYLQAQNKWTPQCLNMINWTAYNQAISHFQSQ